jgi:hypothetical protein
MAPPAGSRPARCHRRTSQPHPGAVAEGWPSHGCPTERDAEGHGRGARIGWWKFWGIGWWKFWG